MALGFTSHYTNNNEQPFGSLILSAVESETAGSVASSNHSAPVVASLFSEGDCDSYEFSVSTNIDYSQYANFTASAGSTETAGSVAYSGGDFSGASAGCASFSGGGAVSSCSVSSASFTC